MAKKNSSRQHKNKNFKGIDWKGNKPFKPDHNKKFRRKNKKFCCESEEEVVLEALLDEFIDPITGAVAAGAVGGALAVPAAQKITKGVKKARRDHLTKKRDKHLKNAEKYDKKLRKQGPVEEMNHTLYSSLPQNKRMKEKPGGPETIDSETVVQGGVTPNGSIYKNKGSGNETVVKNSLDQPKPLKMKEDFEDVIDEADVRMKTDKKGRFSGPSGNKLTTVKNDKFKRKNKNKFYGSKRESLVRRIRREIAEASRVNPSDRFTITSETGSFLGSADDLESAKEIARGVQRGSQEYPFDIRVIDEHQEDPKLSIVFQLSTDGHEWQTSRDIEYSHDLDSDLDDELI